MVNFCALRVKYAFIKGVHVQNKLYDRLNLVKVAQRVVEIFCTS